MADDYRNSIDGAGALGSLTLNGTAFGELEAANDHDIFSISLTAGTTYTFEMRGQSTGDGTLPDPYFQISGPGASSGSSTISGGTNDRITFTAKTTAVHYIDAYANFSSQTGTYRLVSTGSFIDDARDTSTDENEALRTLALNGSLSGSLETAGDHDIFAMTLTAGTTYFFEMRGESTADGTLSDPYFQISGPGASSGSSTITGGTNDRITFTARTGGVHYIDAYANFSSQTGTYKLLSTGSFVDDARDTSTDENEALRTLALNGSQSGNLETAGDHDIFAMTLTAGTTYFFEMRGESTADGTLSDPYFQISGPSASSGSSTITGGTNDRITFTARTSGVHYIDAYGNLSTQTGTYKLLSTGSFIDDARDTITDENEALRDLSLTSALSGNLETPGDHDIFRVQLTAGVTYTFEMRGQTTGDGTLSDPYFQISGTNQSAGSTTIVGGTNDRLTITANQTGFYYIDAYADTSALTGTYRIGLAGAFTDDFRDTATDESEALGALTVNGAAVTGNLEAGADHDIFSVQLTAGTVYTFEMRGQSTGDGTLSDPYFQVSGPNFGQGSTTIAGGTNDRITFQAATTGTYFVDAYADTTSLTGTYKVSVVSSAAPADDYRDVYNDASEPIVTAPNTGAARTGRVEAVGDVDVFQLNLTAGVSYTFDLTSFANGGAALANPYLRLLGASGQQILVNDNYYGSNSRIVYTATTNGTFYLEAKSGTAGAIGGYQVASRANFDDVKDTYNSSTGEASATLVTSLFGSIEQAGDVDVFSISLTAGVSYTFDLSRSVNGGVAIADTYLRLLNGSGQQILVNDNYAGTNSRIVYTATATGAFFLEAKSVTSSGVGNYLIASKANYDDVRDTYNSTNGESSATLATSLFGSIESQSDIDLFSVSLTAGVNYTFDLSGSTNGGPALANAYLRLLGASGQQILVNDNYTGYNARIVYTATTTGTFYLEAKSASATAIGNYLIASRANYDDVRDTFNSSNGEAAATVVTRLYGSIEVAGDVDLFSVSLTAGVSYTFDLTRTGNGGAALGDAYLRLLDSAGQQIFVNDNYASTNARIVYTAASTGTFYLEATSATSGGFGNYLIASQANFDDVKDAFNSTNGEASVTLGTSLYGAIERTGDLDVYAFQAVAGRTYTFDLSGSTNGGGALADAYLTLTNSSGAFLIDNDDFNSLNARITYTATSSTTVYLEVKSATPTGTGNYLLTAKTGFDDHADTITDRASPRGQLTVGTEALGTIETAGDSDVFQFNLVAGRTYSIAAAGGDSFGALSDPDIHLFNAAGTLLAYSDDANGGPDPQIVFQAASSGVYYLDVGGVKSATGFYAVGIFEFA